MFDALAIAVTIFQTILINTLQYAKFAAGFDFNFPRTRGMFINFIYSIQKLFLNYFFVGILRISVSSKTIFMVAMISQLAT